jgi:hypothetical protein
MMMTKERVIERLGPPTHTLGFGCSGGSYQAEQIADNYPGLLDGIVIGCSFPDVGHAAVSVHSFGARLVWMPTFSSANHINAHKKDAEFKDKFPQTKKKMLDPVPLSILDAKGHLLPEVGPILDMIAENDVVLSSGHLHISECWPLFEEAKKRGVKRLLCNHPSYVVDASLDDIRRLAGMGVYCEHSMCMFVPGSKFHFYQPSELDAMIKAATPEKTILGSDLGQIGNPRLVDGFRNVIETCLDLGYSESQVRSMVSANAVTLMGL